MCYIQVPSVYLTKLYDRNQEWKNKFIEVIIHPIVLILYKTYTLVEHVFVYRGMYTCRCDNSGFLQRQDVWMFSVCNLFLYSRLLEIWSWQ